MRFHKGQKLMLALCLFIAIALSILPSFSYAYKTENKDVLSTNNVVAVQGIESKHNAEYEVGDKPIEKGDEKTASMVKLIRKSVAEWYYVVRTICVAIMLLVLIFIGIKITISTATDKAFYKKMLTDWVAGMLLVFGIHYIMIAILTLNNTTVKMIEKTADAVYKAEPIEYGDTRNQKKEKDEEDIEVSIFETLRTRAYDIRLTVGTTGMVMYITFVYFAYKYTIIYLKRTVNIIVLALLGPPISVMFAINKTLTGKSKLFSNWLREFIMNVFLQTAHAVIYAVFMLPVLKFSLESIAGILFAIILLKFMADADKIFRRIFGITGGAGSVIGGVADQNAAREAIMSINQARKAYVGAKPIRAIAKAERKAMLAIPNTLIKKSNAAIIKARANQNLDKYKGNKTAYLNSDKNKRKVARLKLGKDKWDKMSEDEKKDYINKNPGLGLEDADELARNIRAERILGKIKDKNGNSLLDKVNKNQNRVNELKSRIINRSNQIKALSDEISNLEQEIEEDSSVMVGTGDTAARVLPKEKIERLNEMKQKLAVLEQKQSEDTYSLPLEEQELKQAYAEMLSSPRGMAYGVLERIDRAMDPSLYGAVEKNKKTGKERYVIKKAKRTRTGLLTYTKESGDFQEKINENLSFKKIFNLQDDEIDELKDGLNASKNISLGFFSGLFSLATFVDSTPISIGLLAAHNKANNDVYEFFKKQYDAKYINIEALKSVPGALTAKQVQQLSTTLNQDLIKAKDEYIVNDIKKKHKKFVSLMAKGGLNLISSAYGLQFKRDVSTMQSHNQGDLALKSGGFGYTAREKIIENTYSQVLVNQRVAANQTQKNMEDIYFSTQSEINTAVEDILGNTDDMTMYGWYKVAEGKAVKVGDQLIILADDDDEDSYKGNADSSSHSDDENNGRETSSSKSKDVQSITVNGKKLEIPKKMVESVVIKASKAQGYDSVKTLLEKGDASSRKVVVQELIKQLKKEELKDFSESDIKKVKDDIEDAVDTAMRTVASREIGNSSLVKAASELGQGVQSPEVQERAKAYSREEITKLVQTQEKEMQKRDPGLAKVLGKLDGQAGSQASSQLNDRANSQGSGRTNAQGSANFEDQTAIGGSTASIIPDLSFGKTELGSLAAKASAPGMTSSMLTARAEQKIDELQAMVQQTIDDTTQRTLKGIEKAAPKEFSDDFRSRMREKIKTEMEQATKKRRLSQTFSFANADRAERITAGVQFGNLRSNSSNMPDLDTSVQRFGVRSESSIESLDTQVLSTDAEAIKKDQLLKSLLETYTVNEQRKQLLHDSTLSDFTTVSANQTKKKKKSRYLSLDGEFGLNPNLVGNMLDIDPFYGSLVYDPSRADAHSYVPGGNFDQENYIIPDGMNQQVINLIRNTDFTSGTTQGKKNSSNASHILQEERTRRINSELNDLGDNDG
ncbi:MAG: hypothetical protein K6D97_03155 [Clostridia bacterium]|nr:hypothetical protein [Clostridia bacterium]